eukprot:TRINITY_DN50293_c0_g1_i1.p1 TRINITY_DN50293_c0_g1~~TRINITY_DN50293_c0_g1_i1.p1  ORF type:complete len:574 (-),score=88.47 TRINITY_DN50293_c0_g1_i1:148-1869(-)
MRIFTIFLAQLYQLTCLSPFLFSVATGHSSRAIFGGEDEDVMEADPDFIRNGIAQTEDPYVVMYYADWCPHCHHFAPVFRKVATKALDDNMGYQFAGLNCADFTRFCSEISISGYPTVRIYNAPGATYKNALSGAKYKKAMRAKRILHWLKIYLPKKTQPHHNKAVKKGKGKGNRKRGKGARSEKAKRQKSSPDKVKVAAESPRAKLDALLEEKKETVHQPPAMEVKTVKPDLESMHEAVPYQHLEDAEVAILYSLWQGTFTKAENGRITGDQLQELYRWLDFLARALPSRKASDDLIDLSKATREASNSSGTAAYLETGAWFNLLEKRGLDSIPSQAGMQPAPHWKICSTYTCGLWSLFHILSQAPSLSAYGFLAASDAPQEGAPTAEEVQTRIRGFVANFFGCAYCRDHFLQTFDSCAHDRCKLKPDDRNGVAIWLWQVHNDVTLRVASEASKPTPEIWPPKFVCRACFIHAESEHDHNDTKDHEHGSFDPAAVSEFLRQEFWSLEWQAAGYKPTGLIGNIAAAGENHHVLGVVCVFILLSTLAVVAKTLVKNATHKPAEAAELKNDGKGN